MATTPIVNVGYDSTNYYVLGARPPLLLVDAGWPGTLPKLLNSLKRAGIALEQIGYMLISHYHPDHAGLAEDLKRRGLRLIVLEQQVAAVPLLRGYVKAGQGYLEIELHDAIRLSVAESRRFLRTIGIDGEIVATPGHSDDSVSLVLDEGCAFTGDLTPSVDQFEDPGDPINQSWRLLSSLGVSRIYPGHGPARPLRIPGLAGGQDV